MPLGFYQFSLPLPQDIFHDLSSSVDFEDVAEGRKGNHLVKIEEKGVPLVRTTSKYDKPAYRFSDTHDLIARNIISTAQKEDELQHTSIAFNNALIEIYDKRYFKMKYHSDQCLDMASDSYVALFSCYERSEALSAPFIRQLKVRDKTANKEQTFLLANNSVVLFSLATNSLYQHKIILDASSNQKDLLEDNRWLGITFRMSKTFIQFKEELPYFINGEPLTMADENQQREFYTLRGQENRSMDFEYPPITYTLSKSDTLMPR